MTAQGYYRASGGKSGKRFKGYSELVRRLLLDWFDSSPQQGAGPAAVRPVTPQGTALPEDTTDNSLADFMFNNETA